MTQAGAACQLKKNWFILRWPGRRKDPMYSWKICVVKWCFRPEARPLGKAWRLDAQEWQRLMLNWERPLWTDNFAGVVRCTWPFHAKHGGVTIMRIFLSCIGTAYGVKHCRFHTTCAHWAGQLKFNSLWICLIRWPGPQKLKRRRASSRLLQKVESPGRRFGPTCSTTPRAFSWTVRQSASWEIHYDALLETTDHRQLARVVRRKGLRNSDGRISRQKKLLASCCDMKIWKYGDRSLTATMQLKSWWVLLWICSWIQTKQMFCRLMVFAFIDRSLCINGTPLKLGKWSSTFPNAGANALPTQFVSPRTISAWSCSTHCCMGLQYASTHQQVILSRCKSHNLARCVLIAAKELYG